MGMPITIIRTIFQIGKRIQYLVSPHWLGGIRSICTFGNQAKGLSLWRKRTLLTIVFGWWIRLCGAFPDRPWKSGSRSQVSWVNMLKRQPFLDYFKWKPFSRRKGGVAIIAKWRRSVSCQWLILVQEKGLQRVNVHWYELLWTSHWYFGY